MCCVYAYNYVSVYMQYVYCNVLQKLSELK